MRKTIVRDLFQTTAWAALIAVGLQGCGDEPSRDRTKQLSLGRPTRPGKAKRVSPSRRGHGSIRSR